MGATGEGGQGGKNSVAGQERVLHEGITGSELTVFEESAHHPFAEEPERFVDALETFFVCAEQSRGP